MSQELTAQKKNMKILFYISTIKTPMRAIVKQATWIEDDLGPNVDQDILDNLVY
jgi:hypothetical protein